MKLLKLFPAMFLFWYPRRKLVALMPRLKRLSQKLQEFGEAKDPISMIVLFFDEVSKWHDRVAEVEELAIRFGWINFGQYDKMIKNLETLQLHFCNAGREKYGWNRTEKGEKVTEDKVFLGNIHGINTLKVSYCKTLTEDGYTYPILSKQARDFMKSHIDPLVIIINDLKDSIA